MFGEFAILITTAQVNNAERAVGVVVRHESPFFTSSHGVVKFFGGGGYYLKYAPGPFLQIQQGLFFKH